MHLYKRFDCSFSTCYSRLRVNLYQVHLITVNIIVNAVGKLYPLDFIFSFRGVSSRLRFYNSDSDRRIGITLRLSNKSLSEAAPC